MRKTETKTNLKRNEGITLIALVITIIVLLILAGVAISMLSGENGILKQAASAKTNSDVAQLSEDIKLTATEIITSVEHKLTEEELRTELGKKGYIVNEEGILTHNNVKYAVTNKGAVKATLEDLKKERAVLYANTKLEDTKGQSITIPMNFKISSESPTEVKKGIVIIAPDGSEFVWVPVDTPSTMYGTNSQGKKLGKLYNFTATEHTARNWQETSGVMSWTKASGDGSNREPDYLNSPSDGDGGTADNKGLNLLKSIIGIKGTIGKDNATMIQTWRLQLENEFKEMIESVEKYRGFYIGRYETSLNASGIAQSISGATSATASKNSANTWYGLYQKEKEYSSKNSLTNIVGSTMIWGSQYDQMLIWMQSNGIDVTLNTPTNLEGVKTSKNTSRVTGSASKDKLNNVYDLLGNSEEWTLEAEMGDYRVRRGGWWDYNKPPRYRTGGCKVFSTVDLRSSRITLHIK